MAPANGVTTSPDPTTPALVCSSGGTIDGLSTADGYAMTEVPPGATVTALLSGSYSTGAHPGNWGGFLLRFYADAWVNGTNTTPSYRYYGPVGDGGQPEPATTRTFSNVAVNSWTNSGSSPAPVGLHLRVYGVTPDVTSLSWNVTLQISGPSGQTCPTFQPSEMFGPNQSSGQQCPACTGATQNSVNSLTGNEHYVLPGFALRSRGAGINFGLAYNSLAAGTDGPVGHGWSNSYGMSLSPGNFDTQVVTQEGGATVEFASADGGKTWVAPGRFNATLVKNADGTWTFTRAHREIFTFDSSGRLTTIADRNGYKTTLAYGSSGLSTVTDDAGHLLNVGWSGTHISTITDSSDPAHTRTTSYGYDSNGNLTSYTDIGGGVWTLGYDTSNRLVSVRSPRFQSGTAARQFHYDSQGRVDWEQDPVGNRTTLAYDTPSAGATEITDPAGNTRVDYYNGAGQRVQVTYGYGTSQATSTRYTYNGAGMVTDRNDGRGNDWKTAFGDSTNPFSPTQTTDPLGRVRTMTYDASGDLTKLTDANGVVTTYGYDGNSNPTTVTVGSGSANQSTTTYHYADSAHPGQMTSLTDPRGKNWTYAYDPTAGTLTSLTDPLGNTTSWGYNPEGWVSSEVSPAGNASGSTPADFTTSYTYNAYGQPLTFTDPLSHKTTYTYDADSNVATITKPDGSVTANTWTADEQLATVTTGSGTSSARTLTYTYTPDGQVASHGYTTATTYTETWNPLGLLATSTDPNGHQTTYGYDANGNLTTTTLAAGTSAARTTTYGYDADNEQTSSAAGSGSADAVTTRTGFDIAAGTAPCTGVTNTVYCTTATSGSGAVTTSFYDALGDLIAQTYPGNKTYTYSYDAAGNQLTSTNPAGVTTTKTYNDAGQLTTTANGQSADNVAYTYTPDGQRHTMVDATGTTTYNYNNADQMSGIVEPNGDHLTYGRDAAGRVSGLTYPDGRLVGYHYNPAGDMNSLTDGSGGTFTFGYSSDGSLLSKQLPNGETITTSNDNADQPTNIALTNSNGNTVANLAYTYTPAGQVASETDTQPGAVSGGGGTLTAAQTYSYDGIGQLKTSSLAGASTSYGYDADHNITTLGNTTQTFNAADQLTSSTTNGVTTTYAYNSAGDRTQTSGNGTTAYGYDSADRMTSSTAPAVSGESDYHPLAGGAIMDTRTAYRSSNCGGPCATLTAGGSDTFQVTGLGGVPANASSVVLNVISAPTGTSSGSITLYPAGSTPNGRDISTGNGDIPTSAVITAVSASGQVTVKSTVAADVIVEVAGYYLPAPSTNGASFTPVNGTRILDTRNGLGTCTPAPCARLTAGATSTIQVAGRAGIPATGVVGVAFTLTDYTPDNYGVTITYPSDQPAPNNDVLSYSPNITNSGLVVTPLSSTGQMKLYSSAGADYTIDIAGYYTLSPNGSSTMFVPFTPATSGAQQILDTTNSLGTCTPTCGTLTSGNATRVQVSGTDVPANASAVVLGTTAVNPTATGYLSLWPDGQLGSNNNTLAYNAGVTTGTDVVVPLSKGWIGAEAHGGNTDLTLDVKGYYIAAPWSSTYTYNGDNQLVDITTSGATNNPHFTYDPSTGIAQRINDHTSDYIYGPDGTLLETTADTTNAPTTPTYYDLVDPLGSTRAQISIDGTLSNTSTYTPYGAGGAAYAGGNTETNTGLTYLLNRYYDPSTATFTTPDPLLNITGQPYSYADNNPTNEIDPTGNCPWCVGAVLGAIVGGGMDLGGQIIGNLINGCGFFNNISWGEVAQSAVEGAALGAGIGIASQLLTDTLTLAESTTAVADSVAGDTTITAADGTEVTGYTRHGLNRAIGDGPQATGVAERAGTDPRAILDALRNPQRVTQGVDQLGRPYKVYTGSGARVVVNPQTGRIISTNPLGRAGIRGGS